MVSASMRIESADGVIYAKVSGVVTLAGIESMRDKLAPAERDARAVCLDYSRALIAITPADLDALARASRTHASRLAVAWVTADDATAALWRFQALRFALSGLRRMATTDRQQAMVWAQRQSTALETL